jgi:hypothetical protein
MSLKKLIKSGTRFLDRSIKQAGRWVGKKVKQGFKSIKKKIKADYRAWQKRESERKKAHSLANKRLHNPQCMSTAEVVRQHKRRLATGKQTSVKSHRRSKAKSKPKTTSKRSKTA